MPVDERYRRQIELLIRTLPHVAQVPVALDVLVRTREELVAEIVGRMPDAHREFLRSITGGEPQWSLLEVPNISSLPAVEWRMRKLAQLDERERSAMVKRIEAVLTDRIDRASILPRSTPSWTATGGSRES